VIVVKRSHGKVAIQSIIGVEADKNYNLSTQKHVFNSNKGCCCLKI